MMASLKPRFKALDLDGSGALDAAELKASGAVRMPFPDDIDL